VTILKTQIIILCAIVTTGFTVNTFHATVKITNQTTALHIIPLSCLNT